MSCMWCSVHHWRVWAGELQCAWSCTHFGIIVCTLAKLGCAIHLCLVQQLRCIDSLHLHCCMNTVLPLTMAPYLALFSGQKWTSHSMSINKLLCTNNTCLRLYKPQPLFIGHPKNHTLQVSRFIKHTPAMNTSSCAGTRCPSRAFRLIANAFTSAVSISACMKKITNMMSHTHLTRFMLDKRV